jgi:lipopolysaccharide transport protein LptA
MAPSPRRHAVQARTLLCRLAFAGGLCMLLATAAIRAAAPVTKNALPPISQDARKLPINVDATHLDQQGDTVVFQNIVITQGDTKVQADRAHAKKIHDFENSQWTFEGNVRITGEQHGNLHSDEAVVEFRNKAISKATITGNPAEFEQKRADTEQMARGHAKEIVYDVSDGTIRLSDDAWLSDGRNEISGPLLVYNIREQQIEAASKPGAEERVHIKIDPNSKDEPNPHP